MDINDSYNKLDKRISLIEQRLDIMQNNHLAHIQDDINNIKKYFLWGVGVVFVQLIAVIAFLATN
jgi:Mg2+ and Co2+ transporter CorA